MKRTLLTTAAICAALCFAFSANANTWQAYNGSDSGNWTDTNHWSAGHAPTASEAAVFPALSGTYTVTMNGAPGCAQTLTVDANATISISASCRLEVGDSDTGQSSSVAGVIALPSSTSVLRFVNSHSISTSGTGSVSGTDSSARIEIANGKTLYSTGKIQGTLTIDDVSGATASFINEGTVEANTSGTLRLSVGGTLDDNASGKWKATAASAILQFHSDIGTLNNLEGEFLISSTGEIEVQEALSTTGRLNMTGGTFDVQQNVTMGDGSSKVLSMTGGSIQVAAGKTFTHY